MKNLDLSKYIDTCKFGFTNAEKLNQIAVIAHNHDQHVEKVKKLYDDMLKEVLDESPKIYGIVSMTKRHKRAFYDAFEMLNSECKNVMDLTMQEKFACSVDIFVTKLQNGWNKIDKAIALSKEKYAPTSNSLADVVQMNKKQKASAHIAKKKRTHSRKAKGASQKYRKFLSPDKSSHYPFIEDAENDTIIHMNEKNLQTAQTCHKDHPRQNP